MRRRGTRWFDLSPLGHPLWWAALALLLLNDNLLKGSGIVPAWLTGKLSDFAFLVVAPALLAASLPVALPRRRTLALLSITGLFVATELSPTASHAVVSLAARVGFRWRLWPDVTDLLDARGAAPHDRVAAGTAGRPAAVRSARRRSCPLMARACRRRSRRLRLPRHVRATAHHVRAVPCQPDRGSR